MPFRAITRTISIPTRLAIAAFLAAGSVLTLTGTAFARSPERDGPDLVIDFPNGPSTVDSQPGVDSQPFDKGRPGGGPKSVPRGYDVSYPQCGGQLPSNPAFAIVGVNGGRVFSANACLADEIAWGGGTSAELYANTANPGPAVSSFWPTGQASPRFCDPANTDTADCAYDYGWNAAQDSFRTAQAAYASLGISASPAGTRWWLDVETENSWRDDNLALNVAALQGEVAYLQGAGVTRIGFYSTQLQWNTITGGSLAFSAFPSWFAGGGTLKGAQSLCTRTAFTGGTTVLAQYFASGFDADLAC